MSGRTHVLSVHRVRYVARRKERAIQEALDRLRESRVSVKHAPDGTWQLPLYGVPKDRLPSWTRGVRVESAGLFQHAVVATEIRGH